MGNRYLRPIPKRLLPDDMLVWPAAGDGTFGRPALVEHVRFEMTDEVVEDEHRSERVVGKVFVDAVNSKGAFEVPAGSRVLIGPLPSMFVRSCKRCRVIRNQIHHWELEVG